MLPIQMLPPTERPRERCLSQGAQALSLRECLAVILGTGSKGMGCLGTANSILEKPGYGLSEKEQARAFFRAMEVAPQTYLYDLPGLGDAGVTRLLAALEIGKRYAQYRIQKPRRPHDPRRDLGIPEQAIEKVDERFRVEPQEWLGFVPLFRSGELGDFCIVERGVRTHVNIEPAELFARVLALRPDGFYLFHNHPSGDPTPSLEDIELTRQVKRLAGELGIRLLGHGVLTALGERWVLV